MMLFPPVNLIISSLTTAHHSWASASQSHDVSDESDDHASGELLPLKAPASFSSICCICSHWTLGGKNRGNNDNDDDEDNSRNTNKTKAIGRQVDTDVVGQTWRLLWDKPSAWPFSNEARCFSTACVCRSLSLKTQNNAVTIRMQSLQKSTVSAATHQASRAVFALS